MGNFNKNRLIESVNNSTLFLSIMKDYINKESMTPDEQERVIDFMKSNFHSNKATLELLGVKFEDTGIIRNLNGIIANLENQIGNGLDINANTISNYINNITKKITENFNEKYGINTTVLIKISSIIEVELKYLSICLPLTKNEQQYYRNEQDFLIAKEKSKNNYETALSHNIVFSNKGEFYFQDENIKYLENAIHKELSFLGEINAINKNVRTQRHNKLNDKEYVIDGINLSILTLQSHIAVKSLFS